jgi:hypothetical protein
VLIYLKFSLVAIIMDNIIEPDRSFDFSKLVLANPSTIQGGAYFTRLLYYNKPFYIQTTKSLTRQGFVKSGKKYYCDLMFDNNSSELINWFENLEETCKKLIFEKSNDWFQGTLEENDVETAFNPVIRIYKSGKFYLLRTNIKNNNLTNEPMVKIYNENEMILTMTDITNETNIISILEIIGIKFTPRSFQIEIDLKQVMVLENDKIFENCLIKTNKERNVLPIATTNKSKTLEESPIKKEEKVAEENDIPLEEIDNLDDLEEINDSNDLEKINNSSEELKNETISDINNILENTNVNSEEDKIEDKKDEQIELDIEELNIEELEDNNTLKEVTDLDLDKPLETITLKKPNQVYYELYKEARNKAKQAKKAAIIAYLEAKNIKKTYMIESINDSDSDFDAEIDEVSESELDGF